MRNIVILVLAAVALCVAAQAQPTWGSNPSTDSGTVWQYQNSMRSWTPHELDSLYKSLNIRFKFKSIQIDTSGDAPWPWYNADVVRPLVQNGVVTMRDSLVYFLDTLCIKWYARIGRRPGQGITIWFRDTCTSTGGGCTPIVGDMDRVYQQWCDSLRIITLGPQIKDYWTTETLPTGGTKNAFLLKVDTIMVPLMFQIYASRGLTTNMSDSTNKWMNVPTYNTTITGWPVGDYYGGKVRYVAWTQKYNSGTLSGGTWRSGGGHTITSGKQLLVRWITNPSTRSGGNDKTKLSLYTDAITSGGDPAGYGSPVQIATFEINDDGALASYDSQTWHLTVVVWVAFVTTSF